MERLTIMRTKMERPSAVLLAVGLIAAIAVADELPRAWATALFAVLLVLDAITISWLTRPCDQRRPASTTIPQPNRTNVGTTLAAPCATSR